MDYVRHGEIQGHYLVFFKAHNPVFYHVWNGFETDFHSKHIPAQRLHQNKSTKPIALFNNEIKGVLNLYKKYRPGKHYWLT
jgi:hypothetical protein